jgi:hypothetical protein
MFEQRAQHGPQTDAPLGLVAMIFLAGSIVLLLFTILPGVSNTSPLRQTYFLRADTSDITGARDITQWTYFYFCGKDNTDCGRARPAPAFGKAWAANADNVPEGLGGSDGDRTTSKHFYLLWRFGWVFFIITLFFQVLAFFSGVLACCGRLGAAISSSLALFALVMHSVAASLMTYVLTIPPFLSLIYMRCLPSTSAASVTFVQARDAFLRDDRDASLGRYAFGFVWGAWAAILIANVLFCIGTRGDKASSGGGSRWRRTRSVRSSTYDGRRVKDDYS